MNAFLPTIHKLDEDVKWTYEDSEFMCPIWEGSSSFIVYTPITGTTRIEGYPNKDGDVDVLMAGTYDECMEGLRRIAKALCDDGIEIDTHCVDC